MENKERKENIKTFYNICMKELEGARINLNFYLEKVEKIYRLVLNVIDNNLYGTETSLTLYDTALTNLMHLTDMLRKFNIKCESKSFNFDYDKAENNKEYEFIQRFTYPKPDLKKYECGYSGNCIITSVKNKEDKLFYMTENENLDYITCVTYMKNYFLQHPKKFDNIPKPGEVFGLYMNGYILRAVIENNKYLTNKNDLGDAYLIDIGETIQIGSEMILYTLPKQCAEFPAQAILCKLDMINSSFNYPEDYLSKKLYIKHKFLVLSKSDSILYVNLLKNSNPFIDSMVPTNDDDYMNTYLTNPFRQYYCDDIEVKEKPTQQQQQQHISNTVASNIFTNDTNENLLYSNLSNKIPAKFDSLHKSNSSSLQPINYFSDGNNFIKQNLFTPQSPKEIQNVDFQTSLLSSTSRSNQSSLKRLNLKDHYSKILTIDSVKNDTDNDYNLMDKSKWYNLSQTLLYNNNNDTKLTSNNYTDVDILTSNDRRKNKSTKSVFNIKTQLDYPSVGQTITIVPTYVGNTVIFFGHYINHEARYKITLGELIRKMNNTEEVVRYTKINGELNKFELVIAKFKDGFWYRARIINTFDEQVRVYYVDYGNADYVPIEDIRKWESRFDDVPFQAIRFKINGIKEIKDQNSIQIGIQYLKKLILDKHTKAEILENIDDLFVVNLYDNKGNNIADELVRLEYAEKQ